MCVCLCACMHVCVCSCDYVSVCAVVSANMLTKKGMSKGNCSIVTSFYLHSILRSVFVCFLCFVHYCAYYFFLLDPRGTKTMIDVILMDNAADVSKVSLQVFSKFLEFLYSDSVRLSSAIAPGNFFA